MFLNPTEIAGPFPLDLSETPSSSDKILVRSARHYCNSEAENYGLNYFPMPNIRVNIWCCDLNGYSESGELRVLHTKGVTKSRKGKLSSGMFSRWYQAGWFICIFRYL